MRTSIFLHFAAICLSIIGIPSKAQHIITAENSNTSSIPLDPFLDEEEMEKDYPYIVSLKYHLREEMLPELFTEIAMYNIPCSFQGCRISLIDIAEATQISRFTTEDLAEAIGKLNITGNDAYNILLLYPVTPDIIENLLKTFALAFTDIYKNFVESLANPSKSIPDILNILNVSVQDFMNAQAYGNDTVRLQVLSTGNYSQSNLNAVLTLTNKTAIDMLKLIPLNTITKQLRKFDAIEFTNFFKNLGVTSRNLGDFYKYLNITPINFLSYPPFIQIVTSYYDVLNPEEVLGTIVSTNKVVTSNKAKVLLAYQNQNTILLRQFANFHAELVENPLVQYAVKNVTLISPEYASRDIAYVEIKNPFITAIAEVSKVYNTTELFNCTYISRLPFGGLYTENILQARLVNYTVVVKKTNETLYNLGSPLFCQDKLYGIAVQDNVNQITFSTFMKKLPGTSTTPSVGTTGQQPTTGGSGNGTNTNVTVSGPGSSASVHYISIFNIVSALFLLKLSFSVTLDHMN